ncbi:hypothetical protein HZY86_05065 [Aerococcaceae bacterium DSM 111020]|nr:hypothetical protein [Aerococcaceae bacterium DSM 111020]
MTEENKHHGYKNDPHDPAHARGRLAGKEEKVNGLPNDFTKDFTDSITQDNQQANDDANRDLKPQVDPMEQDFNENEISLDSDHKKSHDPHHPDHPRNQK